MTRVQRPAVLGLAAWLATTSAAFAQVRPYIGYAYPAGGQQGTTFQVRLGGQGPGLTRHNSESGLYGKFRIPSKPRLLPYSLATFR